ncbi:uncharacterized protein [Amphiura filiformis]|uniref:uncharacterized protein n=1 Tax=Amphiura filiformis TaxID=82378 RepID=UPI003B225EEF
MERRHCEVYVHGIDESSKGKVQMAPTLLRSSPCSGLRMAETASDSIRKSEEIVDNATVITMDSRYLFVLCLLLGCIIFDSYVNANPLLRAKRGLVRVRRQCLFCKRGNGGGVARKRNPVANNAKDKKKKKNKTMTGG